MLKAIPKSTRSRLALPLTIATLTGICFFFGPVGVKGFNLFNWFEVQPAVAQFSIPDNAAQQVYERLPDLPRENQYVSKETGKVDENNTLVRRLMRYHIFVKRRPPGYRLDWKLTLADYIGAHEYLVESQYPSANTLNENPMERDRKVIEKLTRTQRDALVNALVSVFKANNPQSQSPAPTPSASPAPSPPNPAATPSLPKPGDAQLLKP